MSTNAEAMEELRKREEREKAMGSSQRSQVLPNFGLLTSINVGG